MNIPNAYDNPRFDQSVDDGLTFKHKTILCMAIKNSLGQIIGVIQLINKFDSLVCLTFRWFVDFITNINIFICFVTSRRLFNNILFSFFLCSYLICYVGLKQTFTKNDENFVEAFAIFCGMGIHNTHMYEKAIVAMAKQSVTLEVLSYHASASSDDAQRLRVSCT